jgi:hypothetical protein
MSRKGMPYLGLEEFPGLLEEGFESGIDLKKAFDHEQRAHSGLAKGQT